MSAAKLLSCALVMMAAMCSAQTAPQTNTSPASLPPADPAITQIRKSVTFIRLMCNDGSQEYDVRGTGFFVSYADPRLGKDNRFGYLVTNRHVALCWNDSGQPMRVDSISIRLNRNEVEADNFSQDLWLNEHGNVAWVVPQDNSIDLAMFPFVPDPNRFDFKVIPTDMLATADLLSQHRITEGEPVFFAGFFHQFPGTKRMQPIVRQGIIAMMAGEKIPFVGVAEKLYLADVHVFGGNSGAPAFINLGGVHGGMIAAYSQYVLLGVVNGEVLEDENFNLVLATTVKGTAKANSGVSTIVPADQLRTLLDDPRLQQLRDASMKAHESQK